MLSKNVLSLLNKQLNHELCNAMLYRQLSSVANLLGFLGCEKLMRKQYEGELEHFNKFCDYITDRNYPFLIKDPQNPETTGIKTLIGICEAALEREKLTTEMIEKIRETAINEDDAVTETFLIWFLNEQIEEEQLFYDLIAQLKVAKDNPGALLLLDQQMGED